MSKRETENERKLREINKQIAALIGRSTQGVKYVEGGMFDSGRVAEILRLIQAYNVVAVDALYGVDGDLKNVINIIFPPDDGPLPGLPKILAQNVEYDPLLDPVTGFDNLQDVGVDHGRSIEQRVSSANGIITGGVLSKASPTTFSVTDGRGEIHDSYTVPENTSIIEFIWPGIDGLTVDVGGENVSDTKIFMQANGQVLQVTGPVTFTQFRTSIFLGVVYTREGQITTVQNSPSVIKQTGTDTYDSLVDDVSIKGSRIFPVDAALSLWIEQGALFFPGINWYIDRTNPNLTTLDQVGDNDSPITFRLMYKDGTINGSIWTVIPKFVNDGPGNGISSLNGNDATIFRLYSLGFGAEREFIMLYGQNEYNNAIIAKDNSLVDNTNTIFPSETDSMFLLGQVCISGNADNFSNISRAWIISGALNEVSSGGISTTDRTFDSDITLTEEECGLRWIYIGEGSSTITLPLISAYTALKCRFVIVNFSSRGSDLTIATQGGDTIQDNNATVTGFTAITVAWGSEKLIYWDSPNTYYETLLTWYINLKGDWIPDSRSQSIGDEFTGPVSVILQNSEVGILGAVGAFGTTEPNYLPYLTLAGIATLIPGEPIGTVANSPVILWGEPVIFKSNSGVQWGFGSQGSIPPENIENHQMIFGHVSDGIDGDQYSQILIGPKLSFLFEQTATNNTDFNVINSPTIVVSLTVNTGPYVEPSSFVFYVLLENLSGRDTNFVIELLKNGTPIYTHPTITMQGGSQGITFSLGFSAGDLPVVDTDVLALRVEGQGTNPNSEAFVLGATDPSLITIRQEPAAAALGSLIGPLGVNNIYRDAYRITNPGPHALDGIYQWRSRGLDTVTFKNATSLGVTLTAALGDVFDWKDGSSSVGSIVIPSGDALVVSVIDEHIWEVLALSANDIERAALTAIGDNRYDYVESAMPFSTSSGAFVIASTHVTPIMKAGKYRLDFSAIYGINATNRRIEIQVRVDGSPILPVNISKESKDVNDRLPLGYNQIVDWSGSDATHTIEIRIRRAGGGGGSQATLYDWRFMLDYWKVP